MTELELIEFINFNEFGDGYVFNFETGEIHCIDEKDFE